MKVEWTNGALLMSLFVVWGELRDGNSITASSSLFKFMVTSGLVLQRKAEQAIDLVTP